MAKAVRSPIPEPFDLLTNIDEEALPMRERLRLAEQIRRDSPELSSRLDACLFEQIAAQQKGLAAAQANQVKLTQVLEKLTSPPLHAAYFLGSAAGAEKSQAWVLVEGRRRLATSADGLSLETLTLGDEVLVNANGILVAKSTFSGPYAGQTARVDSRLADGRLLVRSGDELSLVQAVGALRKQALKLGDIVRYDAPAALAFETVPCNEGQEFLVEAVPDLPLDSVGGQDVALEMLITALTLALANPEKARRYRLLCQRTILMIGPPGTGKTLMARVAASQVQRLCGKQCHIAIVKPGQFEDPYVGVTQRRIRECFAALRAAGGFGILFLDELESIARTRGNINSFHSDKFLAALLAELQGFDADASGNLAVIACTNRRELLDPAICERMEVQIPVERPKLSAARAIFSIHLPPPPMLPYHPNGEQAILTRNQLIEQAVTRFYSPNAGNEIARIRFRDGSERIVWARDLASGRAFSQIARAACQSAALREIQGGDPGLILSDVDEAVSSAIEKLGTLLTRENVHHYLSVKQDVDVVAVEPIVRRVTHPHRYT